VSQSASELSVLDQHAAFYRATVAEPNFKAYADSGKKLDIGKSCVRFKQADELPLTVIGEAVRRVSLDEFIEMHERARAAAKQRRGPKSA
jgi:hypothetical protein